MRPIPVGASAAMMFSLIVAFVVSPWAALRLLRHIRRRSGHGHEAKAGPPALPQDHEPAHPRCAPPLDVSRWGRVAAARRGCFRPLKWVRVKMLPFDNKSEFQVIIDMPDGTPLEQTTRVAQALGRNISAAARSHQLSDLSGTSGPYNFNGLVRHYFLRQSAQSG
jgi:multidrug efflux pump subunit AcrB